MRIVRIFKKMRRVWCRDFLDSWGLDTSRYAFSMTKYGVSMAFLDCHDLPKGKSRNDFVSRFVRESLQISRESYPRLPFPMLHDMLDYQKCRA